MVLFLNKRRDKDVDKKEELIPFENMQEICDTLTKNEILDKSIEKVLQNIAEDFVDNVSRFACKLAKHRNSDALEPLDLKLAIEKLYGINVPIKQGTDNIKQVRKNAPTANYKKKMQNIKKGVGSLPANSSTK